MQKIEILINQSCIFRDLIGPFFVNSNMNRTEDFPKLWIGSFIKICLVNFLIFVNFHALLPTFPFFISSLGGDAVP